MTIILHVLSASDCCRSVDIYWNFPQCDENHIGQATVDDFCTIFV